MKHYTTIEQSKKLVELGLNPDTADMHYSKIIKDTNVTYIPELLLDDNDCDIPCWSLGALINIMPSIIYKGKQTFTLEMHKDALYHLCYESRSRLNEIWITKKKFT